MSVADRLAHGLAVAASLKQEAIGRTYRNESLIRKAVLAIRMRNGGVKVKQTQGERIRWVSVESESPPKDGSIIILDEGGGNYALVKWIESDELVGGGAWFLAHGGPAAFIYPEDLIGMRWKPFVP